ncbi:MAG: S9 family peptidase [Verrucomicrobiales bacterium]
MAADLSKAPLAARKSHAHREHGVERSDPYYWLRERENSEVLDYLKAENAHTKAAMADTKALQETLFKEIKGRIKQDDDTYPVRWKNFHYYSRYREGSEYPLYFRRRVGADDAAEEITFDVPSLAKGHKFYDFDEGEVSPDEKLVAFSVDTEGRRIRTLQVKNLESGEILPDRIGKVDGGHAWAADNQTLFYTRQDPETLREYQVWRHRLGTPPGDDVLVYEEKDETFSCYVSSSQSEKYIIIGCSQTLSDEYRLLEADNPEGEFRIFTPRRRDLEHDIEHYRDGFYIRTNKDAENFRLMWTPLKETAEESWQEVVPGSRGVYLSDFEVFDDFIVLEEREGGLNRIRVRGMQGGKTHTVNFGEAAYSAWTDTNLQFDTEWLRYGFSSLKTPDSLYEYNLRTRERRLLKRQPVLGGYDPEKYTTERHFVTAGDGARVPLSIIYRRDAFQKDGTAPLLLYAYGSYGYSTDASFSSIRVSLLDRGFAYAIAHVRGGQEMGRAWYDDGRLLNKKNTFSDFINCAEFLLKGKYTSRARLCASGGSAGGLLMGVVVNERPDLFTAIIADVPWVDCVTTMFDESIPLTAGEYDEWGNPANRKFFDYILSYSPYDNVREGKYPAMLVLAGLHDSQVQYWEPAKWVARLRARKTDDNLLLLKTDMDSGHGGASGRFGKYRERALEQAFLIRVAGKGKG